MSRIVCSIIIALSIAAVLLSQHAQFAIADGNVATHGLGDSVNISLTGFTNPYCRFVENGTNKIWDGTYLATSPAWSTQDVALTVGTYTKLYAFTCPSGLPNGSYTVPFYDNATPADTDPVVLVKYVTVQNGKFLDIFEL